MVSPIPGTGRFTGGDFKLSGAGVVLLTTFLASSVEAIEMVIIVLGVGATRGWRSALIGAAAGFAVLAVVVAVLGVALTAIPIGPLRVLIGTLLLLFGLQWYRKGIARVAARGLAGMGATEVRDDDVPASGMDWVAFLLTFKGVLLEGLEIALIVVSFGVTVGQLGLSIVGAVAAVVVVAVVGFATKGLVTRIPRSLLQLVVGTLLTSFGTFWSLEGLGVTWPQSDADIVVLIVVYGLAAAALISLERRRIHAHPDGELRGRADGVTAWIEPVIQLAHQVGQADGIDVEHRRRVGIRPHLGRVASDEKKVAKADGRCPQKVAQHAEQVAIAAAIVNHRLDSDLLLDQDAREQRTHPALRPRPIGHVDRVHTCVAQSRGVAQHFCRVDSAGRNYFHGCDELTTRDFAAPSRSLREWNWLNARIFGRKIGLCLPPLPRWNTRLPWRQGTHALDHRRDMLGRGSAAATDDLGACLNEVMRVGRHVFGARHVHAASAHVAWHSGIRLRAQLAPADRCHLLDRIENDLRTNGAV